MLVTPLAVIFIVFEGVVTVAGQPASSKLRTPPRAITSPIHFDLAPRANVVRHARDDRDERLSVRTFGQPQPVPSVRYSVAGLAMGLGQAAVDHDRFDMRALRLEQGRGGRMRGPLDAGLRLRLTGGRRSMQADFGVTGGVAGVIGNALKD